MSTVNDSIEKLRQTYPKMYGDAFDVYVGQGWIPIVESLSNAIHNYTEWKNRKEQLVEPVTVQQVKEKFGELRFYYNGGDETIGGMVTMAEYWAAHTCEECGHPGVLRTDLPWIKTLCEKHYLEERKKRYG